MLTVEYKYGLDADVETPFGERGIVTMLGYDEAGPQYYVRTQNHEHSGWFKEKQLRPWVQEEQ